MTMMRAPKGGIVSQVNGQFYNGGEFSPVHGKSKKVQKVIDTFAKTNRVFGDSSAQRIYEVERVTKGGIGFCCLCYANTRTEIESILALAGCKGPWKVVREVY